MLLQAATSGAVAVSAAAASGATAASGAAAAAVSKTSLPNASSNVANFDTAKLIRDVGACVGGLALVMPDNKGLGLDELIARLRIEWPGIDDARLPAESIEQFFNLTNHLDDAVLSEFDPVALAEVSRVLDVALSVEDCCCYRKTVVATARLPSSPQDCRCHRKTVRTYTLEAIKTF